MPNRGGVEPTILPPVMAGWFDALPEVTRETATGEAPPARNPIRLFRVGSYAKSRASSARTLSGITAMCP